MGYRKAMMPFNFSKKSRLDPKVTIDINFSKYRNSVSIESITFDEYGEVVFTPINGFYVEYEYHIQKNILYVGEYTMASTTTRIPW